MKQKILIRIAVCLCLLVLVLAALNAYVYFQGKKYIIGPNSHIPHATVAIILGAGITQSGMPSGVLMDRVKMAISLYKSGTVSKILMSGGNSTIENNEVNPIQKILIANNIPAADIFLDHAGFDTYSTMYRAKAVFSVDSAIIVTQEFHLPRAVYLARSVGINAYGVQADQGTYTIKNYLREYLSRPNAFWDVLIHRIPKYLGPIIPITGDGSTT